MLCLAIAADVPEDEGQHLQDVFPRASEFGGMSYGCHDEAYLDESSQLITIENAHRLWNSWSRWWDPTKDIYLEKSPPNAAKFPFLQEMFRDAGRTVFISTIRHPIAVLHNRFFGFGGKNHGEAETAAETASITSQDKLRHHFERKMTCWLVSVQIWCAECEQMGRLTNPNAFRLTLYERLGDVVDRLQHKFVFRYEDMMQDFDNYVRRLEALVGLETVSFVF